METRGLGSPAEILLATIAEYPLIALLKCNGKKQKPTSINLVPHTRVSLNALFEPPPNIPCNPTRRGRLLRARSLGNTPPDGWVNMPLY
jgi:hypothetical protein